MRLIIFLFVSYFCFNQVLLTSTNEVRDANLPGETFESKEIPLCNKIRKTELMDLNDDCQLLVLENLDFMSLLSVAEINSRYKLLASEIVKPIFRKKLVDISILKDFLISGISLGINIEKNFIEIQNRTIAERVLRNFGHHVQKLSIKNVYKDSNEANQFIYKLINLNCAKSLTEITLGSSTKTLMSEFTNTFANVQNVYIQNMLETERGLNEIFPALRHLDFFMFKVPQPFWINVTFTNLESLSLRLYQYSQFFGQEWAAELIRRNSHIRHLKLKHASAQLIKIAADSIPELEKFELESMGPDAINESIYFRNVKEFVVNDNYLSYLFNYIKFGNVQELTTNGLAENMFKENGFLIIHENLTKLRLVPDGAMYLNTDTFRKFALANSTLQDIFIGNGCRFELGIFLQLIENNKQLQRVEIEFLLIRFREAASEELLGRLSDIWSIDEFEKNLILRKNVTSR